MGYQVSVLVPVYNVEAYIETCVRSLMEQTYPNIQFVFVDDCSTDNSLQILNRVVAEYPDRAQDVLVVSHPQNRGLAAARNTAIDHATGSFISHVDSDDYMERDAIENLVSRQVETGADIVSGQALAEYEDHDSVMELREYASMHDMTLDMIKPTLRHTLWGRLIRKSLYTDNALSAKEGANIGEDAQVMPCLAYYATKAVNCHCLVYHYNCKKENSYSHKIGDLHRLCQRGIQDVESYQVVREFFRDKDAAFFNEAERSLSKFVQLLMGYYVLSTNKQEFDKLKQLYQQLKCGRVKVRTWHEIHAATSYNFWYCKLTSFVFKPVKSKWRRR